MGLENDFFNSLRVYCLRFCNRVSRHGCDVTVFLWIMVCFFLSEFATVVERLHCYFVIFRVLFNISEYGEGNIKEEKKEINSHHFPKMSSTSWAQKNLQFS